MMKFIKFFKNNFKNYIYLLGNPSCEICSNEILYDESSKISGLCKDCYDKLKERFDNFERCKICSSPLTDGNCTKFHHKNIEKVFSLLPIYPQIYEKYLKAKYRKDLVLMKLFCEIFVNFMPQNLIEEYIKNIDIVTYVPISNLKKATRKYNPAKYLAKRISKMIDKPLKPFFIESGFRYFHLERKKGKVQFTDRFKIKKLKDLKDKNILIVDDIYTTGKTVSFLADLVLLKGASKIFVLTLFNHK